MLGVFIGYWLRKRPSAAPCCDLNDFIDQILWNCYLFNYCFLTFIRNNFTLFITCCWLLVFDLLESAIWCLFIIEGLSIYIAGSTEWYKLINDSPLWLDSLLLLLFLRSERVLRRRFRRWLHNFKETHCSTWSEFIVVVLFVILQEYTWRHEKVFILVHYDSSIRCRLLLLHHYL